MWFYKFFLQLPLKIEYVFLIILLVTFPLVFLPSHHISVIGQKVQQTQFPSVAGNKIIDSSGNQIVLRGVQIPSEFNLGWHGGSSVTSVLNQSVFAEIHRWGANTLRLPVGAYEYQKPGYMPLLDSVIQQANQAGLYVILANFEDSQAMGGNSVLDQQGLDFWKFIAAHYSSNTMVLYDLINEPHNISYQEWLNGGGAVVGMAQTVQAMRSSGGKQIIIAEANDTSTTFFNGFTSFISDPNIIYSLHIYFKDAQERLATGWDSEFGNLSQSYPILVGEWALLPNARYPSFCQGLDAQSGTTLVTTFLSYMQSHNINWTAWAFNVPHLILSESTFTPTILQDSWCCGLGPVCNAGMGQIIKNFLANNPSTSVTASPSISSSPSPSGAQMTTVLLTVCPHGLGNCGDNVNSSGGNTNPLHTQRAIRVSVLDANNQLVLTSSQAVSYNQASQNFQGSFQLTIPPGQYLFQAEMNGFLSNKLPVILTITPGISVTLPTISLVTGDINGDNQLDILDYNILIGCFGEKITTSSCAMPPTTQSPGADINDDGVVDGVDYNLFLRELSVQKAS